MKKRLCSLFATIALIAIVCSCSIEKRIYMPGFCIEKWNSAHDKREVACKDVEKKTENLVDVGQAEIKTNAIKDATNGIDENVIASPDNYIVELYGNNINEVKSNPNSSTKTTFFKKSLFQSYNNNRNIHWGTITGSFSKNPEFELFSSKLKIILIVVGAIFWVWGLLLMLSAWGIPAAVAKYNLGKVMFGIGSLLGLIGYLIQS